MHPALTRAHSKTHTNSATYTCTCMHTHTHTHTHTHAVPPSDSMQCINTNMQTHTKTEAVHSVLFVFLEKEQEVIGILLMPLLDPAAASLLPFPLPCPALFPSPSLFCLKISHSPFQPFSFLISSHFSLYWSLILCLTFYLPLSHLLKEVKMS